MGNYKRKMEVSLKFTAEEMENVNRRLEAEESNSSVIEHLGVRESTSRKR
jgi:hypothetical protein